MTQEELNKPDETARRDDAATRWHCKKLSFVPARMASTDQKNADASFVREGTA